MGSNDYELYRQAQGYISERREEARRLSLASRYGTGGLLRDLRRAWQVLGHLLEPGARPPRRPSSPQLQ